MLRKWFIGLLLVFLCLSFSFAQNGKKQNQASWEYLEISVIDRCGIPTHPCRRYHYFNSGVRLNGPVSVEWLSAAGWELATTVSDESSLRSLLFRRAFNKERTDREVEWLAKELEQERQKLKLKPLEDLIDLDGIEANQKLIDFNKAEEAKLRTALEKFKSVPLKIISVSSNSETIGRTRVGAEILLEAPATLLNDGNRYRSSDVDKFYKDAVRQILENARIFVPSGNWSSLEGNASAIAKGVITPKIGDFILNRDGIVIKVLVALNYRNKQIIVAQGWVYSQWLKDSP